MHCIFIFVIRYKALLTSNASVPYLLINSFPIFGVFYLRISQIKPLLSFTFTVFYIFVKNAKPLLSLIFFMFCVSVFPNLIPLISLIFFMFCVSVFPNIIPLLSLIFYYVLCLCFLKHNTADFSYLFWRFFLISKHIIPLLSLIFFMFCVSVFQT